MLYERRLTCNLPVIFLSALPMVISAVRLSNKLTRPGAAPGAGEQRAVSNNLCNCHGRVATTNFFFPTSCI